MEFAFKHFLIAIVLFNAFGSIYASEKPKKADQTTLKKASQTAEQPSDDQKQSILKNEKAHAQACEDNLFGEDDGTWDMLGQARMAYNAYWKQALLYRNQNPSYKVLSFSEFLDPANAQKK